MAQSRMKYYSSSVALVAAREKLGKLKLWGASASLHQFQVVQRASCFSLFISNIDQETFFKAAYSATMNIFRNFLFSF